MHHIFLVIHRHIFIHILLDLKQHSLQILRNLSSLFNLSWEIINDVELYLKAPSKLFKSGFEIESHLMQYLIFLTFN